MRVQLAVLSLVALAATKAIIPRPHHMVHEKRDSPPLAWVKRNAVPRDAPLPMRIGLTQRNLERGYDLLMDVAHHASPNYGKHYTAEEVNELFAPADATVAAVRAWLEDAGIAPERVAQSANKAWLAFDASAAEAEKLLLTKYHFFEHQASGDVNVACDEYHVPAHVRHHVDYITPGVKLLRTGKGSNYKLREGLRKRGFASGGGGRPQAPSTRPLPTGMKMPGLTSNPLAACNTVVTPPCISKLYNISTGTKSYPGNQLGIYEDGDVYAQADLDVFFSSVAMDVGIPNGTHPELRGIDGGMAPVEAYPSNETLYGGAESALDFMISYPIIYPQNSVLYQTDDYYYSFDYTSPFYQGLFNNFLDAIDGSYCTYSAFGETGNNAAYDAVYPDSGPGGYRGSLMCGVYKPTNVISISYGINEYDISAAYQQRQCSEYMKLGLQGVSIVVASGDSGVAGRPYQNGHANGCLGNGTVFNPDYPGTCPYLTMAGSTTLAEGAVVGQAGAEIATTRFYSGGGFSNIYPMPSYQSNAVNDYFTKHAPDSVKNMPYYNTANNVSVGAGGGVYNRAGRAYPDVAAIGDNILIFYFGGEPALIGGTSASAPAFAAVLNRINEERLAAGKSTIGFVNPTLYAHPEVFNDVTVGDNNACAGKGFNASVGWDPVTGLGTPNYPKMLDLFMSLD